MSKRELEWCLYAKWSRKRSEEEAQKAIRLLLGRKGPKRLLRELSERVKRGGDSKVPYDTFIIVCALLCRGKDSLEDIKDAVSRYKMTQMLFAGYRIFLHGGRHGAQVLIRYKDEDVSNRYAWLSQWDGMGYYSIYSEIFQVSRILEELDKDKFWHTAKEDTSDFILLNWRNIFWRSLPPEKALELLSETENVRRRALGFWHLATSIPSNAKMEQAGADLLSTLSQVPETVLFPCLYEYLVTKYECPKAFRDYLLKVSRDRLLRQEAAREKMLTGPREAIHLAALISEIPNKRRQKFYWDILTAWLAAAVEAGTLAFTVRDQELAEQLISMFPKIYQEQLAEKLRLQYENLHTAMLDYIVRPSIHQRELAKKSVIDLLLSAISGT